MTHLSSRLTVGSLAALVALSWVSLALGETLAFTHATVHTVSGPVLQSATVIVEGDRIMAVGEGLAIPPGARVIALAGKHLYPGLVSANTVMGLVEIRSVRGTRDETETGTINPSVRAETQINPDSEHFAVARVNGITTALVAPRGGPIAGTSALIHMQGWTHEDMTIRSPVALHVQWPAMRTRPRSFSNRTSPEDQKKARKKALDDIRNAFEDARAYWKARDAEGEKGVPRHDADVKWQAMGRALRGEIPVVMHALSYKQIRAALDFATEQGLANILLASGQDAAHFVEELRERSIGVICERTHNTPRRTYEPYDAGFTLPAILLEAGVDFCISDGAGARRPGSYNPMNTRNLPYMAALASAHGLPKVEALKAVTLHPARMLGAGKDLGSIEEGKLADLIVADGDILEITTTVERVYIAGREVPMVSRHTRLFEKYDARPRGEKARPVDGGAGGAAGN
jgi:imidazolonepropionase-like amidohydrolase